MSTSFQRVPTTARACGVVHALRRADASSIDTEAAEGLIERARAGKLVSVVLDATTFVQTPGPNRNLTRFREGALKKLARSYVGVPFLRDHEQNNLAARGGRVLSSELVKDESGSAFRMSIELTEPWAVESALRGSIDRFSIGWHATGELSCSVCGEAVEWWLTCEHQLGKEYDGQICQVVFSEAEGVEVSAVSVPAVVGTELEGIRAALARSRGIEPQESIMKAQLCSLLGLAAAATEDQVVAAVEGLRLKSEADAEALTQVSSALKEARLQLAVIEEQTLTVGVEREIDRAIAEGRIAMSRGKDGQRVETAIERSIRHAAKVSGLAGVKEMIDGFPSGVTAPVGVSLRSATPDPSPAGTNALTAKEIEIARSLGVKPDDYAAHKAALVVEQTREARR